MIINEKNIDFFTFFQADINGKMGKYNGRYIRVIKQDKVPVVKRMFTCGMIDRLVQEGLFVASRISDLHIKEDESDLIVEHEDVSPIIEPSEITISMRMDIANMYLRILRITLEYGYELHDITIKNVSFRKNNPILVDFGSLVPFADYDLETYQGFIKLNIWPIKLTYNGYANLLPILENDNPYEHYNAMRKLLYPLIPWKLCSLFEKSLVRLRLIKNIFKGTAENVLFYEKLYDWGGRKKIVDIVVCFRRYLVTSNDYMRLKRHKEKQLLKLERRVNVLGKKEQKYKYRSRWEEYQTSFEKSNVRWKKIEEFVRMNNIKTILEFGANQGNLARYICENCPVEQYWATDYDNGAVNICYNLTKKTNYPILPIVLSCTDYRKIEMNIPRFRSECVIALALTHHLILSQAVNLDYFFKLLYECTEKFLVIEFMPWGLCNAGDTPSIPDWYTLEWFLDKMKRCFEVISVEENAKNRIMIYGKKVKRNGFDSKDLILEN